MRTNRLRLLGLRSRPLGTYLSALGVLRLVAEQLDDDARGRWLGSTFELATRFDAQELSTFLLEDCCPAPLVAPWNGSDQGGFAAGAATRASDLIEWVASSGDERLAPYREAIGATRQVVASDAWQAALERKDKRGMLLLLRNRLPDAAVVFLDTAVALTADDVNFPPILGTGGNFGRLDLVTNYLEHLRNVVTGPLDSRRAWLAELTAAEPARRVDNAPGPFDPIGTGGVNLARSAEAKVQVNPLGFVTMMEGALLFAATATRRLGAAKSRASAPFTVDADPFGFASAARGEESKGELWAPLWDGFISLPELETLMAEGRATWAGRQARTSTDLVRAARTLGVDRGITGFERYGFLVRNGQVPVAVPLGQLRVREARSVELTADLDKWLSDLRRWSDDKVPAAVRVARNRVGRSLFEVSRRPGWARLRELLIAVAGAERAVRQSASFRKTAGIRPVPALDAARWLPAVADGSTECGLAWVLAAGADRTAPEGQRSLGQLLRGVADRPEGIVFDGDRPAVSGAGARPIVAVLADIAVLRCRTAPPVPESDAPAVPGVRPQFRVGPASKAPAWAVEALASGVLDEPAMADWLSIFALMRAASDLCWPGAPDPTLGDAAPAPAWRLLAPWWGQGRLSLHGGRRFTPVVPPSWGARIRSGHSAAVQAVTHEASRWYRAAVGPCIARPALLAPVTGADGCRLLAALLVPTGTRDLAALVDYWTIDATPRSESQLGDRVDRKGQTL